MVSYQGWRDWYAELKLFGLIELFYAMTLDLWVYIEANESIKLFVGQIPRLWSETELLELFSQFGAIFDLQILNDRITGQSRGCAFVTFQLNERNVAKNLQLKYLKTMLHSLCGMVYMNFEKFFPTKKCISVHWKISWHQNSSWDVKSTSNSTGRYWTTIRSTTFHRFVTYFFWRKRHSSEIWKIWENSRSSSSS